MTSPTLIILNPNAGSGRAARIWTDIEPALRQKFGDVVLTITQKPEDVLIHLQQALEKGIQQVIAIGGDGTNHVVVNAIQTLMTTHPHLPHPIFAQIPMGTGRDFSRTLHIPSDPHQAVEWLSTAKPMPLDVGHLSYDNQTCYFLNIASVGVSGEVDRLVNQIKRRRSWTFKWATIRAFMSYSPPPLKIWIDGNVWYEGKAWLVAVANGLAFGHGMVIAPDAHIDDGIFDIVLVEAVPRLKAIRALNTVYTGQHIYRPDVRTGKGKQIVIESEARLELDLDGEYATGHQLTFTVKPAALQMLIGETSPEKEFLK